MLWPTIPLLGEKDLVFRRSAEIMKPVSLFVSPATRMLLSSEGLTTTLLGALVGGRVRVRHAECRRVPGGAAPAGAAALLGAGDESELLVRGSLLSAAGDGYGPTLSRNLVVARLEKCAGLERCLTDATVPLGEALHGMGTGHRRTVLDVGCRPWPEAVGRLAAFKTYVLWHHDDPVLAINELFNPDLVPAAVHGGRHPR
jgi:chorismate-pyruvate lyase